jgi:diketogulonate reductase-like aldo/keto reductase
MYANEASVGVALQEAGVPREEIYLTTKVLTGVNNLEGSLRNQLKLVRSRQSCHVLHAAHTDPGLRYAVRQLKVSYVDLYLIHSPLFVDRISEGYPTLQEAWRQMERLKELGLTK